MIDPRRRPTGVLLAAVAAVIAVAGLVSVVRDDQPSPVETLRRRVESEGEPQRFAFRYQRAGTRVLDCVLPNLTFDVVVDRPAGIAAFRLADRGTAIAIRRSEMVLVSRDLFDSPPFQTPWLSLPTGGDERSAEPIRRALGTDLAGYLFAADLPQSGRATVLAALDIATAVRSTGPVQIDGTIADDFRITVDPAEFTAAASGQKPSTTAASTATAPRFDVAVARRQGTILRLAIGTQRANGAPGPPENGWLITYRAAPASVSALPADSALSDAAGLDLTALAAARTPCQLPS